MPKGWFHFCRNRKALTAVRAAAILTVVHYSFESFRAMSCMHCFCSPFDDLAISGTTTSCTTTFKCCMVVVDDKATFHLEEDRRYEARFVGMIGATLGKKPAINVMLRQIYTNTRLERSYSMPASCIH